MLVVSNSLRLSIGFNMGSQLINNFLFLFNYLLSPSILFALQWNIIDVNSSLVSYICFSLDCFSFSFLLSRFNFLNEFFLSNWSLFFCNFFVQIDHFYIILITIIIIKLFPLVLFQSFLWRIQLRV